jgi:hypothetical protein
MEGMRKLFVIIAFVLTLSCHETVLGCSCAGYPSPCQAYAAADAVIIGQVRKVQTIASAKQDNYGGGQIAYVLSFTFPFCYKDDDNN